MKSKLLRFCIPVGLLLNSACHIVDHLIPLGDAVVLTVSIVSIILLFMGLFDSGWRRGKTMSISKK